MKWYTIFICVIILVIICSNNKNDNECGALINVENDAGIPVRYDTQKQQPFITVKIDNRDYDCILDTGSAFLLVEECDAKQCTDAQIKNKKQKRITIVYGQQTNENVLVTELKEILIGNMKLEAPKVALAPEDSGDNILGLVPRYKTPHKSFIRTVIETMAPESVLFRYTIKIPSRDVLGSINFNTPVPDDALVMKAVAQEDRPHQDKLTNAHFVVQEDVYDAAGGKLCKQMIVLDTGTTKTIGLNSSNCVHKFPKSLAWNDKLFVGSPQNKHSIILSHFYTQKLPPNIPPIIGCQDMFGYEITYELKKVNQHDWRPHNVYVVKL